MADATAVAALRLQRSIYALDAIHVYRVATFTSIAFLAACPLGVAYHCKLTCADEAAGEADPQHCLERTERIQWTTYLCDAKQPVGLDRNLSFTKTLTSMTGITALALTHRKSTCDRTEMCSHLLGRYGSDGGESCRLQLRRIRSQCASWRSD
jgi:hypothetical protein